MNNSLHNYFADTTVAPQQMKPDPLDRKVKVSLEKPVSFRPPNQELCDALNAALDATGATVNDLIVVAVQRGLPGAVGDLLAMRREAEKTYLKKYGSEWKGKK